MSTTLDWDVSSEVLRFSMRLVGMSAFFRIASIGLTGYPCFWASGVVKRGYGASSDLHAQRSCGRMIGNVISIIISVHPSCLPFGSLAWRDLPTEQSAESALEA